MDRGETGLTFCQMIRSTHDAQNQTMHNVDEVRTFNLVSTLTRSKIQIALLLVDVDNSLLKIVGVS